MRILFVADVIGSPGRKVVKGLARLVRSEAGVHVAIVTARNAPSHERALSSLKEWGVRVNDAFFLGGVEKARVLEILKPHIFFDDQAGHLAGTAKVAPSVHVPFGISNATPPRSANPLH